MSGLGVFCDNPMRGPTPTPLAPDARRLRSTKCRCRSTWRLCSRSGTSTLARSTSRCTSTASGRVRPTRATAGGRASVQCAKGAPLVAERFRERLSRRRLSSVTAKGIPTHLESVNPQRVKSAPRVRERAGQGAHPGCPQTAPLQHQGLEAAPWAAQRRGELCEPPPRPTASRQCRPLRPPS